MLDLILLFLDHCSCCLVLRGQLGSLGLFFFLLLKGHDLLLLLDLLLLSCYFLGFKFSLDFLLLSIVNHLFQLLLLRLSSLEKYITLGNCTAQFLKLLLQHSNLHLVVLYILFGDFKQLSEFGYGVFSIDLRIILD